eukprot:1721819-Rhodomonas_salina.1
MNVHELGGGQFAQADVSCLLEPRHSRQPFATVDADVPTRSAHAWRDHLTSGPFEDPEDNTLWCSRVLAGATDTDYLSTVNTLEPDLKSHSQAMNTPASSPSGSRWRMVR